MPRIDITNFWGEMPRVESHLLADNYASVARNVDLRRGQIAPLKGPLDTGTTLLSTTETLYWFNREALGGAGYWFQFDGDVDVVAGPIVGDTNLRTYFTGDGVPKYTTTVLAQTGPGPYPTSSYDLGIPAPAAFTATGPAGTPPAEAVNASYVITFIDEFGAEGPPSIPTTDVERWDGETVALTNIPIASGNFNIVSKRIYRSEVGGNFQFVADIVAAQTTFNDTVVSAGLGAVLPSTEWVAPDSNMIGLVDVSNGVLMGWYGKTVAFSEPFRPHAWPPSYELALEYEPVAAALTTSGIVVATKGKPYLLVGSSPAAMSQVKIDEIRACVSKRSMVDMGAYAVYASTDGLVAAGGTEASLISEAAITPEQWRALKPETIHAYRFDDRYLAFYDDGTTQGSFTFHPKEGFLFYDEYADIGFLDEQTGDVYLKQVTALTKWNEGTDMAVTWRSKKWHTPRHAALKVCKVDADAYPVSVEFFQDGVSVKSLNIPNKNAFRVPSQSLYRDFELEVTGAAAVNRIQLATNMSELI